MKDAMNAKEKATDVSKCPSCGANLMFSPEKQKLACEHCGTAQDFDKELSVKLDIGKITDAKLDWSKETHVFRCNNCGAKEIIEKTDISKSCSFCGTTNVAEIQELTGLKPNAIVPYKISKDTACINVIEWAKKKVFAPKAFKKSITPEEIRGTYNPVFTFDAKTASTYKGVLGKHYYTTHTVNGRTVTTQHTRWFNVSGDLSKNFAEVTVQASDVISQKTIDKLLPFETNNSLNYDKRFLHGFSATQYNKDGLVCWQEARSMIDKGIRAAILSKYQYDVVQSLNVNTNVSDVFYKYCLLPVYVGHCSWRTKLYNFFVNGFSGKVTGKVPLSPFKITLLVLGIAVAVGIAAFLYLKFGGG